MTGLPWSASAHAKDIWTTPDWELREKLCAAEWMTTCTASGHRRLAGLAPAPERVALNYHGLDFARFPAPERTRPLHDGSAPAIRVNLLSVGRAVEKKGYEDLLQALARLPEDLHWYLVHVGGGARLKALRAQAARLGLGAHIDWRGALPQEQVLALYRTADLFVLASRIAGDGDRDGLPNVLMEAQSQGLACLSTRVSAIPELIEDGNTGVLTPPGDVAALADALARLIRDPQERARLGAAGSRRVRECFTMDPGIDALAERFGPASPAKAAE
jgi:glycosyltransferase involved in cell wall biosynthesis